MDDSALIRYYVEKSKEWIFQSSNRNYRIEDDEILDLDSLSLGSNEDTWLYSSDEKTTHSSHEMIYDNEDVTSPPSFSSSNFVDEVKDSNADSSLSISSMSPLIDVNNWNDSLIHIPDVSPATIDNFLAITPVDDRKSKSYFRSAIYNQFHSSRANTESQSESNLSLNKCKTEYNAFQTFGSTFVPSNEPSKSSIRKPCTNSNESVDKSSILHSVENKLFTITDADSCDTLNFHCKTNQQSHESAPNDYIKRSDSQRNKNEHGAITTALSDCANTHSSEYKAVDFKKTNECDRKFCSSKTVKIDPLKNNTSLNACENEENYRRSTPKKHIPICQSTPMLLNRYLKYNKSIEEDKNYSKWRTSSEFLKADTKTVEYVIDKNELNVSYVKHASNESIENYTSPSEDEANKTNSNLNTTYSKSEGLLNSTYDVHEEDDQISSASESSISSLSSKPSTAIRDVQKMAQLQERSLQKQFQFKSGAESSKSSEISSSNESISAFSPVSSSNEGQIDLKTCNAYSNAQRAYHQSRKPFTPNTLVYSSQTTNIRRTNSASVQHGVSEEEKHSTNLSKGTCGRSITFKYKPFTVNGDSSTFLENQPKSTKDEQNLKTTSSVDRSLVAKSNSKECTPAVENSQHLIESKPNVRSIPFVSKLLSFKTVEQSDSSLPPKESRNRDDDNKMKRPLRCASPGPVTHIPRPSSRIPQPRTSASCTRYSKTSFSSSKK